MPHPFPFSPVVFNYLYYLENGATANRGRHEQQEKQREKTQPFVFNLFNKKIMDHSTTFPSAFRFAGQLACISSDFCSIFSGTNAVIRPLLLLFPSSMDPFFISQRRITITRRKRGKMSMHKWGGYRLRGNWNNWRRQKIKQRRNLSAKWKRYN